MTQIVPGSVWGLWRLRFAKASGFFAMVGIFTISWDLLANVSVGPFNVKISVIAFLLAALASLFVLSPRAALEPVPRCLRWTAGAMIVVLVLASAFARDSVAAFLEVGTVLLGALIPCYAVLSNGPSLARSWGFIRSLVWGALFACAFGVYQLVAFYVGFPQFIEYSGVSGGVGRISAFSYEPAMFGYFLTGALVAAIARLRAGRVSVAWGWIHVALIFSTLILLNSRAVFLVVPLLLVLLRPVASGLATVRQLVIGAAGVVVVALGVFLLAPSVLATLARQFLSIFDPTEAASNAPRLQLYEAAVGVATSHPWLGVGPSNFGLYIQELNYSQYEGVALNKMVVNNIWLQAQIDGGAGLLALQIAFVVLVGVTIYWKGGVSARILTAGWLSVLLVGGMVVSNFWDATLWVLLALAFLAKQLTRETAASADRPPTIASGETAGG